VDDFFMPYKDYSKELEKNRCYYHRAKERNPEWYEQRRIQALNKVRQLRLTALQYYSHSETPFCACPGCGESRFEFLTIDHINGNGNKHRKITGRGSHFYLWLARNNFPDGFRVLCYNCNCSRGHLGYCPHEREK
jgi:hypothetical protein